MMVKNENKRILPLWCLRGLLLLALGCSAWCFWSLKYPQLLAYHEQTQMFLFDREFLLERLAVPAGMARYVGEFAVQFYNNLYAGGAILAAVFVVLQMATWKLVRRDRRCLTWYVLSFVPVLTLWIYMGDENVQMTFPTALLMAMAVMICYPADKSLVARTVYATLLMPVLHWLAGPAVLMFGVYMLAMECLRKRTYLLAAWAVLWSLGSIIICTSLVPYPLSRLFLGINYNTNLFEVPLMQFVVMALFVLVPFVVSELPTMEGKKSMVTSALCGIGVATAAMVCIPLSYNEGRFEVLYYDLMVRGQQWDKIVATAEKKTPESPLTVASLNLALAMRGELGSRGMQFYQNGWQGAFPPFNKNSVSSIMTGEIYYHLGLVNTAQRLDFEAMEAMPDNAKSARLVKRLAETNIINGQYEVARKYLLLLQKTLFYRRWADSTMSLLGNSSTVSEEAIDNHPVYGRMRKLRLTEDFLFSEQELDKMMGQLVMKNQDNYLAVQYLLFLPLLERNQQKYLMYKEFVQTNRKTNM